MKQYLLWLIKRNPLRIFSILHGWFISKIFVDETTSRLPIVFETPGMGITFRKRKTGKLIINGHLLIEKRGAINPYGNVAITIYDGATLTINGTVKLGADVHLLLGPSATMVLGSSEKGHLTIGHGTEIIAKEKVEIGSGSTLSWDILIMDSNGHPIIEPPTVMNAPILIEDNVWLGCRSTILKGVRIGAGSIVGSAAVVVKNVPTQCAVAGNPAKIVKENVIWME